MAFVMDADKIQKTPGAYTGPWGTQCVALVQLGPPADGSQNPPATSQWRKGIRVATAAPDEIKKGTVIATFTPAGTYPTASEGARHAAVYLSHNTEGIKVIDQWASKTTPSERTLKFVGYDQPRAVDKGDHYYVVELTQASLDGKTGINEQILLD